MFSWLNSLFNSQQRNRRRHHRYPRPSPNFRNAYGRPYGYEYAPYTNGYSHGNFFDGGGSSCGGGGSACDGGGADCGGD